MRVIFTCGGTAGHINPALSVASYLKKYGKNVEILFVGAENAMETKLVPLEGFEIKTINIRNLVHSLKPSAMLTNAKTILRVAGSLSEAKKIIKEFKPDVVVGMGGYASFPVAYAAAGLNIPTVIHESNAIPGLTTKMLAARVTRVLTGFAGVEKQYPKPEKVMSTGTPVKQEFLSLDKQVAKEKLGLDARPVVLSFFGSLGARDMNSKMLEVMKLAEHEGGIQLLHSTGKYGWETIPKRAEDAGIDIEHGKNVKMYEYIYDMTTFMAAADIVICRAGASTLNELMVAGKPAIIVPSPNVANNHQEPNARELEKIGGAYVLLEKDITDKKLWETITTMIKDTAKLETMSVALRKAAMIDSTERIAKIISDIAEKKII